MAESQATATTLLRAPALGIACLMALRAGRMTSNLSTAAGVHLSRMRLPECILDDKVEWWGKGFVGGSPEQQFHKYEYPAAGYSRIQMLYRYGGSKMGTMGQSNRYAKMYRSKRLPFVVSQTIWFEGETQFCGHYFAGMYQLRALGHRRMGQQLRLQPGLPQPSQSPGDYLAEEVHRAVG